MPIYEYLCLMCSYVFEELVFPGRIQRSGVKCPKCKTLEVGMLPSMIGLAMHNTEMITPRDGYKVRRKAKKGVKDGDKVRD